MYGGISGGLGGIVGGGGAMAGTGVEHTSLLILLAVGFLVSGALLLRSQSLRQRRNKRP